MGATSAGSAAGWRDCGVWARNDLTPIYGTRVLTGKACRLADGSMGQVAIHESDGEWVEVCVQA